MEHLRLITALFPGLWVQVVGAGLLFLLIKSFEQAHIKCKAEVAAENEFDKSVCGNHEST